MFYVQCKECSSFPLKPEGHYLFRTTIPDNVWPRPIPALVFSKFLQLPDLVSFVRFKHPSFVYSGLPVDIHLLIVLKMITVLEILALTEPHVLVIVVSCCHFRSLSFCLSVSLHLSLLITLQVNFVLFQFFPK